MVTKACILCGQNGEVLAAHPIDLRATGKNAPTAVGMVAETGQTVEIVEIPEQLTKLSTTELFRTHRVKGGRLVVKKSLQK